METIFNRRSVRKYTDKVISDEQLKQIIKAGMAAPSAKNSQEWVFIVIRDKEIYKAFLGVHPNAFSLNTATAAILVCADLSKEREPGQGWWIQDCAAAMENMLLEATAMGLGSLWMGVHPKEDRIACIKEVCGLPEGIEPLGLMSVGEPTKDYDKIDRYMEDRVFFNTYGTKWEK
ncbi:nitroreductase family protein [Frisingicoccus sp.]|uniref:nitroreductase family protein n=1 Tax=Frisingicoccus sp. TaxID=1918627 RepID=UPI0025C3F03A|nr:nitroreductase family protein [Frisingicoccus sp.]